MEDRGESHGRRRLFDSGELRLVLLKLDEQVQWMFHRADLPLTLAPVLCRIADPLRQRQVATRAARRQLTVSEIERIVDRGVGVVHRGH